MHERRLAGAVMADDADALAFSHREIDAVQSPDGAIGFFDAVQRDKMVGRFRHCRRRQGPSWMAGRLGRRSYFFTLAAMAAFASLGEYCSSPPRQLDQGR